jgi:hypothetical protein
METERVALDPRPARELTDRECCKLLGGTIGCLATMAPPDVVAAAVQWWADHQDVIADMSRVTSSMMLTMLPAAAMPKRP